MTLNYRNSPEIYAAAKAVLSGTGDDPDGVDGNETALDFAHPPSDKPHLRSLRSSQEESRWVCDHIRTLLGQGTPEHHIAIVSLHIEQSAEVSWDADSRLIELDPERVDRIAAFAKRHVRRMTIHQAKGFEFPIVFLMGLAQEPYDRFEIVRLQENADEIVRALLYVGMTRARDRLYLSASGPLLRQLFALSSDLFS